MKLFSAALGLLLFVSNSFGSVQNLPFADPFSYAEGNLFAVATGIWDSAGNTGSELSVATASTLSAPAGLVAASGKGVRWSPSGIARRAAVQFAAVPNTDQNAIYVSFLLNIQTPPSSGAKLIAYLESSSSSTTSPQLGIFVDSSSRCGIGKKVSAAAVNSQALAAGTHFVVVRYLFHVVKDCVAFNNNFPGRNRE
jgi:hypothetical protein